MNFNRVWNHYKPSILGVFPLFFETPKCFLKGAEVFFLSVFCWIWLEMSPAISEIRQLLGV